MKPLIASCVQSFTSAEIAVLNGIKTSIATSASPVTFVAANYNGSEVALSGTIFIKRVARSVTISRANSPGSYTTTGIVLTGTRGGAAITETLTPLNANGNDKLDSVLVYDEPPTIAIPAQVNTSGAWTIGVQDIACPSSGPFAGVKTHLAGFLHLQGTGSRVDILPTDQHKVEPVEVTRLYTSATRPSPTLVGLSVYIV